VVDTDVCVIAVFVVLTRGPSECTVGCQYSILLERNYQILRLVEEAHDFGWPMWRTKCTAAGVDYITKPIQVEELHVRVGTHLTIRKLRGSACVCYASPRPKEQACIVTFWRSASSQVA
jgi:hypothetical protein